MKIKKHFVQGFPILAGLESPGSLNIYTCQGLSPQDALDLLTQRRGDTLSIKKKKVLGASG